MEYTDYETGKGISRERYIERGLERGELVGKENCGCVVIQDRTAGAYIVYCDKHASAPDLYEACKAMQYLLTVIVIDPMYEHDMNKWMVKSGEALAKAEGK